MSALCVVVVGEPSFDMRSINPQILGGLTPNGSHFAQCRLSLCESNAAFAEQKATLMQRSLESDCHWADALPLAGDATLEFR